MSVAKMVRVSLWHQLDFLDLQTVKKLQLIDSAACMQKAVAEVSRNAFYRLLYYDREVIRFAKCQPKLSSYSCPSALLGLAGVIVWGGYCPAAIIQLPELRDLAHKMLLLLVNRLRQCIYLKLSVIVSQRFSND